MGGKAMEAGAKGLRRASRRDIHENVFHVFYSICRAGVGQTFAGLVMQVSTGTGEQLRQHGVALRQQEFQQLQGEAIGAQQEW